jgi:hypothetical protein
VNKPAKLSGENESAARPVFISYATADRKRALSACRAIERRGTRCWISSRDVAPGENYQEAIVRSIREAPAMVLVFSEAANNSDEIKKELSLASKYKVAVLALRIEDVEPSDAFAYELSTRQWIDAFEGWDKSLDALVGRIQSISNGRAAPAGTAADTPRKKLRVPSRTWIAASAALFFAIVAAAAWWALRPSRAATHPMTVRLAGFEALSPDLPGSMPAALNSEIAAAFNADGVIGVSTAAAPPAGRAPAFALGGTIQPVGDSIRVITRFTNERSGAILWSDSVDYDADQISQIPHKVAIDAGIVVRCGLSGASTYRKTLPDSVLKDYMQYCQETWAYGGTKTLLPAQRVVAAVPDFSWGWSAVQTGYMQAAAVEEDERRAEALRAAGLQAAEKALRLDPRNSEALDRKTYLLPDPYDWIAQEKLYKAAIAAKPLDCGCQHYGYGLMLAKVGRIREAVEEQRAATEMLALWPDSQIALSRALLAAGRSDEAQPHLAAAIDLSTDPTMADWIASNLATETGDYAGAIRALSNPDFQLPSKAVLLQSYRALAVNDPQQKLKTIKALLALPKEEQGDRVAALLASLGATHEALQVARDKPWLFFRRSMRPVLDDPYFPAVANQLGLMRYWKTTRTRPDVCGQKNAPPFCRMI